MKKMLEIDYVSLENDLDNIDQKFETLKLNQTENNVQFNTFYNGRGQQKYFLISTDVQKLTKQIIYYFTYIIKNFKFTGIYEKQFLEAFKFLIKDKEQFTKFLNMVGIQVDQFIQLAVYICPTAFTSNLIKFIQTTYLDIKVQKKKKKKSTKSKKKK